MKKMLGPVIYACAKRSWLCLDNLKNGRHFEAATQVTVTMKEGQPHKIVGIGNEQLSGKVDQESRFYDAFDHPRTWVSSTELAGATLFLFMRKVLTSRVLLRPIILFHPLFTPQDGWSDFELRNIAVLWVEAGARRVMVCEEPGPYPPESVLEKLDTFRELSGIHRRR